MIIQARMLRTPVDTDDSAFHLQERTRSTTAILGFVVLAFVWSWALGFAGMRVKGEFPVLSMVLMIAAGFGPSLAGFAVVAVSSNGHGLRDWFARCLNWRVDWRWFALAFVFPPAIMLLAVSIHAFLGGSFPATIAADKIPLLILNFALVLAIGGPLGEEFGWRGFAMPALRARMGWRAASLIIGLIWGAWHLPLFFVAGTAQSQMPILVFMLNILAGSVVFGWLCERTQGSVLPALVLHTSLNAWAGILILVPTVETGRPYALVTALLVIVALALILTAGGTSATESDVPGEGLSVRRDTKIWRRVRGACAQALG